METMVPSVARTIEMQTVVMILVIGVAAAAVVVGTEEIVLKEEAVAEIASVEVAVAGTMIVAVVEAAEIASVEVAAAADSMIVVVEEDQMGILVGGEMVEAAVDTIIAINRLEEAVA